MEGKQDKYNAVWVSHSSIADFLKITVKNLFYLIFLKELITYKYE